LINAIVMAGFDRFDPGHAFFLVLMADFPSTSQKTAARWRAKGVSVVRENVLNVRTQVAFDVPFDLRVHKP